MGIKSLVKQALAAAGYEINRHGAYPGTLFPPGHFYSPIVDLSELERDRARVFDRIRDVPDIELNEAEQLQLVKEFREFYQDLPFEQSQGDINLYYYDNPFYSYGDAILLS